MADTITIDPHEIRRQVQSKKLSMHEAITVLSSWILSADRPDSVTLRVIGTPLVDIEIPGYVVPHVRVGRERGTRRALRYHAYKRDAEAVAALALRETGAEIPEDKSLPWYLFTTHHRYYRRGDADNIHKAVADVLEGLLYANDRQVRAGGYEVLPCEKGQDRTTVVAGILTDYPR